MTKRKETNQKKKTSKIVKSAVAKGKGIAQNQSVVVNIQEKKKRTYKRKPKISATSQVAQSAFNYGTSAMNTTMFQQPLSNIVPQPPEFRNQVIPAPIRQSINNDFTEPAFGRHMLPPLSRTFDDDEISVITTPPDLFDKASKSKNFISSMHAIDDDDFNTIPSFDISLDDGKNINKHKSITSNARIKKRLDEIQREREEGQIYLDNQTLLSSVRSQVSIPQQPKRTIKVKKREEIAITQPVVRRIRRTKEQIAASKEEARIRAMIKAGERELQMRRDNPQPKKIKKKTFIA